MVSKSQIIPADGNDLSDEEQWVKDSLQLHLDDKVESLNYTVTSKLSAARKRAIAQEQTERVEHSTKSVWFSWTNALGSAAVLALAVIAIVQFFPQGTTPDNLPLEPITGQVLMEDLNMLSATDDIEFYQTVEFLEWMESNSG